MKITEKKNLLIPASWFLNIFSQKLFTKVPAAYTSGNRIYPVCYFNIHLYELFYRERGWFFMEGSLILPVNKTQEHRIAYNPFG